jgi:hypothetical protein
MSSDGYRKSFRVVFLLLCWEGFFSQAYDAWFGPVYITGLAGELGLNISLLTLLASLPYLGSAGQLFGLFLFEKMGSPRKYTLTLAKIARCLWFLPVGSGIFWGVRAHLSKMPFPTVSWFSIVAVVSCLSSTIACSSGAGWNAWVHDLIPEKWIGRFFGAKQRYGVVALIAANMLGMVFVAWRAHGYAIGYAVMGVLALICAALSTSLLTLVPEVKPHSFFRAQSSDTRVRSQMSFQERYMAPLHDPKFVPVLCFGTAFNGAMQIATSYFPYYFTHELHISMSSVVGWAVLTSVASFIVSSRWGKMVDQSADLRSILCTTGFILAMMPLVYVFAPAALVRWYAPFDYFIYGLVWSGFNLANTALLFRASPPNNGVAYFSVYAAFCGISGAVCTFLGGNLAAHLSSHGGFRALWLIATLFRLIVLWIFLREASRDFSRLHLQRARAAAAAFSGHYLGRILR